MRTIVLRTSSAIIAILLCAALAGPRVSAQPPVPWHLTYDFRQGRVIGYIFLMQATVGPKTEYLGGTVIFKKVAEDGGPRAPDRLAVIDNMKVVTEFTPDLISPQLPTSNLFLPKSVFANRFHGIRPKADGDLPRMLGDTAEWFFPKLPAKVGETYHKEGYWNRSQNVRIPSYFYYDSEAVSESGNLVRVEDKRSLKSNDGFSLDVQGKGVFEFDKKNRLMQRRAMNGVHTVLGETMFVNIRVERLSEKKMRELTRQNPQRSARDDNKLK